MSFRDPSRGIPPHAGSGPMKGYSAPVRLLISSHVLMAQDPKKVYIDDFCHAFEGDIQPTLFWRFTIVVAYQRYKYRLAVGVYTNCLFSIFRIYITPHTISHLTIELSTLPGLGWQRCPVSDTVNTSHNAFRGFRSIRVPK